MRSCFMVVWVASVAAPAFGAEAEVLAVMPTRLEGVAVGGGLSPHVLDEHILAAIVAHGRYGAIGITDVETLLAAERQADVLECDDVSCLSRLGGLLGSKRVLAVTVAALADSWAISAKVVNVERAVVEERTSTLVEGSDRAVLASIDGWLAKLLGERHAAASDRAVETKAALESLPAVTSSRAVRALDFLETYDQRRYAAYARSAKSPMSVREWVDEQNTESAGVTLLEGSLVALYVLAPVLVGGDDGALATLYGLNTLALATVLTIDALDVGEVHVQFPVEELRGRRDVAQLGVSWSMDL